MCDVQLVPDLLQSAILEALRAATTVSAAISKADAIEAMHDMQLPRVDSLREGDVTSDDFTRHRIMELRELADALGSAVQSETVRWFVHDQHEMSGGHEETALSPRGVALSRLHLAVCLLADCLSEVVNLSAAHRLSEAFRN